MDIHGPLQTRGETRCPGGVSVSCTRHESPKKYHSYVRFHQYQYISVTRHFRPTTFNAHIDNHIKVTGNAVHTSVYDKRDDFEFPIVNFSWSSVMFLDSHRAVFTFLSLLDLLGVVLAFLISIIKNFNALPNYWYRKLRNHSKVLQVIPWAFIQIWWTIVSRISLTRSSTMI